MGVSTRIPERPQRTSSFTKYAVIAGAAAAGLVAGLYTPRERPANEPSGYEHSIDTGSDQKMAQDSEELNRSNRPTHIRLLGDQIPQKLKQLYKCGSFYTLDFNSDGKNEFIVEKSCKHHPKDWDYDTYQEIGGNFLKILDDDAFLLSQERTNGYRNVFGRKIIEAKSNEYAEIFRKYEWNGREYVESNVLIKPDSEELLVDNVRSVLEVRNPDIKRRYFFTLQDIVGHRNALKLLTVSQFPQGIIPSDVELERYLAEFSKEKGINYMNYQERPEDLHNLLFGEMVKFVSITSPADLGLAVLSNLVKQKTYHDHVDRLVKTGGSSSGPIQQFKKKDGEDAASRGTSGNAYVRRIVCNIRGPDTAQGA